MYITYHYLGEYPDHELSELTVVLYAEDQAVFYRGAHLHGEKKTEESTEEGAKRLLRESGIEGATLTPVNIYAKRSGNERTLGMLYLAEVEGNELFTRESLQDHFLDRHFSAYMEDYLRPNKGGIELWDLYDKERRFTGRTHKRGELIPKGCYHSVVHVWVQNTDGRILLTQRSLNKSYALMWECSGGSVLAGEDSLSAAIREVHEETGLSVRPENGVIFKTIRRINDFKDIWVFREEIDLERIRLQERETCGARLIEPRELLPMKEREELVPYRYLEELYTFFS